MAIIKCVGSILADSFRRTILDGRKSIVPYDLVSELAKRDAKMEAGLALGHEKIEEGHARPQFHAYPVSSSRYPRND